MSAKDFVKQLSEEISEINAEYTPHATTREGQLVELEYDIESILNTYF